MVAIRPRNTVPAGGIQRPGFGASGGATGALGRAAVAQPGAHGGVSNAPAPMAPPQTTQINGQTYLPRRPSGSGMTMNAAGTGLDQAAQAPKVFGANDITSEDGSIWSPMTNPGSAGGYPQAATQGGGYPQSMTQDDQRRRRFEDEDRRTAEQDRLRRQQFENEDRARMNQPISEDSVPPVPGAAPTFARIPPPGVEDSAGAEHAAFTRAHGRIGALARGSMMATRDEFNGRGLAGSRSEGRAVQGVISDAANQNADVIATQAVENLHRQQSVNDRNYAGEMGQRGADMGYATTIRGQDIGAADSRAAAKGRLEALRRMATTGTRY